MEVHLFHNNESRPLLTWETSQLWSAGLFKWYKQTVFWSSQSEKGGTGIHHANAHSLKGIGNFCWFLRRCWEEAYWILTPHWWGRRPSGPQFPAAEPSRLAGLSLLAAWTVCRSLQVSSGLDTILWLLDFGWGLHSYVLFEVMCCPHALDALAETFLVANLVVLEAFWSGCEFCFFYIPNPPNSLIGRESNALPKGWIKGSACYKSMDGLSVDALEHLSLDARPLLIEQVYYQEWGYRLVTQAVSTHPSRIRSVSTSSWEWLWSLLTRMGAKHHFP